MSSIVDKIQKLLAMAEGTDNEAEAALFAEKVAQLLAANNLQLSDLSRDSNDDLIESDYRTMYLDPWRRRIIRQAGMLYFCDMFLKKWWDGERHQLRDGVVLVGRPHNIYITKIMSEYLINTTMKLAIQYAKDHPSRTMSQRAVRLAFERGCGEKLAHRLYKLREEKAAGEQIHVGSNPGNLPALYADEAALAKAYIDSLGLRNAGVRGSDLSTSHSNAGIRAANAISLEPQLTREPSPFTLENKE